MDIDPTVTDTVKSDPDPQPKRHVRNKFLNGIGIVVIVPSFVSLLLYGSFVGIKLVEGSYVQLSLSLILIGLYFLSQSLLAIVNNNYFIPKLKSSKKNLPEMGIHIIGRGEEDHIFYSVLKRIKHQTYPKHLIKKVVLCIDGNKQQGANMMRVFKGVFPKTKELHLGAQFSTLSTEQKEQLLEEHKKDQYLVVTQPHGGRRQVKYTAFSFSNFGTDYVMHCDSDTIPEYNALEELASVASGYNATHPKERPCGGVVGEIKINNVFNYSALQMQISYWYAFESGRASQSIFKCVTTISGAMGLFHSKTIRNVIDGYCKQKFFGISCIFGEDRHLTSGLIQNGSAVIYNNQAFAYTETPLNINQLLMQQARWYKGFYRQTLVFLPRVFNYSWWSVMVLIYSFIIPLLAFITIFTSLLKIESLIFLMIYVFIVTTLMSLRGIIRNCQFRFLHALWHPFFFFLLLLPVKTMALFYCICPDAKGKKGKIMTLLPVYIWIALGTCAFIGIGFVFNIVVEGEILNRWMSTAIFSIGLLLSLLAVHWLTWGMGIFVPDNEAKLEQMYNMKQTRISNTDIELLAKEFKNSLTEKGLVSK